MRIARISPALLLAAFFASGCGPHPNDLGPYQIGYTTFVAEDPARVIDPDAPTPPKWMLGEGGNWPLHIRVMYPVDAGTSGAPVMYSTDNPLYPEPENRASSYPSTNGALADVPAAGPPPGSSGFPMVVYSHGGTQNGLFHLEDAHEILASHGFVVVLIDHTADGLRSFFGQNPDLENDGACKLHGTGHVACRTPDIPFAIDVMLDRNEDPSDLLYGAINPDAIGLEGYSRGFGATLATTVGVDELGLVDSGIIPDLRVKALFQVDGNLKGVTEESLSGVNVPVFAFMGAFSNEMGVVRNQIEAATSLLLFAETPRAKKMGSWIDGPHVSIGGDICSLPTRVLDAVEAGTATSYDTKEMRLRTDLRATVLEHCPASVFEGHSDQDLESLGFDPDTIPEDMPTGIPIAEISRLRTFYMVAFFERHLAHKGYYAQFLTEQYAYENEPLIHFGVGDFPGAPEEVLVCHMGTDKWIEPAAFHAHLGHGDTRGSCGE